MARLAPSNKRPECYEYKCVPSDYVCKVAYMFQVPLQHLLSDNTAVVPQPDMWLSNTKLLLCGDVAVSTGQHATSVLDALLAIKLALRMDEYSTVPQFWDEAKLQNGKGYCKWHGIDCFSSGDVTGITLKSADLRGTLPDAALLQSLPHLVVLDLSDNKLRPTTCRIWYTWFGSLGVEWQSIWWDITPSMGWHD
eukprot:GHUV01042129.1.p1 GENE.GHUV01042129.1~~GHUV01042129.1.p1  ORF type:complete len:194 (-),score=10.60 GHUV01042129.1:168-749(-)